jgi:lipoyl(octanoyl) transferase
LIEWAISDGPVAYPNAVQAMEARAAKIATGDANELVWLLEHPALFTRGASARPEDLRYPDRFPVFDSARGGQFTYHGPGQRVAYVMLDLSLRGRDVRRFVCDLEAWIIAALAQFNVSGERRPGRVGVWVDRRRPEERAAGRLREDKIAAVGVRIRKWVSFHGISLNVDPDLSHFQGITPCGIDAPGLGVTSLHDLGHLVSMAEADIALKAGFEQVFGEVTVGRPPA